MKVLVTGAAGFIGFHYCKSLLDNGYTVVGLDTINNYYDVQLKYDRLKQLGISSSSEIQFGQILHSTTFIKTFKFIRLDIQDRVELPELFKEENFNLVVNFAAQAGVRHSIDHPEIYVDTNVSGFLNVLECCRHHKVKRLIYASSSSVYGNSVDTPFLENQVTDSPVSLYGATKKSNELMAQAYTHIFGLETIGLRFFTVYGPWGRPDMAIFLFTKAIRNGEAIQVFNEGNLSRDFTYIDDIVRGMFAITKDVSQKRSITYNIGNGKPVALLAFIESLETRIGKKAIKKMQPMQDGDVHQTWASTERLEVDYGYESRVTITEGIDKFVGWYEAYYGE